MQIRNLVELFGPELAGVLVHHVFFREDVLIGHLVDQRLSAHRKMLPPEADEQSPPEEAERIARQVLELHSEEPAEEAVRTVHLDAVDASEAVLLGPVHVGIEMWRQVGLEKTLERCGFSHRPPRLAMIRSSHGW